MQVDTSTRKSAGHGAWRATPVAIYVRAVQLPTDSNPVIHCRKRRQQVATTIFPPAPKMFPAAPKMLLAAGTPGGAEARAQPALQPAPEPIAIDGVEMPWAVCGICGCAVCESPDSLLASVCPDLHGNAEISGVGTSVAGSTVDLGMQTGVEGVASLDGKVAALHVAEEVAREVDVKVDDKVAEELDENISEDLPEETVEELAGELPQDVAEEVAEVIAFPLPSAGNFAAHFVGGEVAFPAPAR